ncbi:MAG: type IV pilin protein [Gammaproteobacteria bacterium]|nr:type IV pilin protein [Gammaproteobacteria bacterium]MBU1440657.1 type IV pilin protein [Gammaproteobacteria bacterium]MBU2287142.1 type IV pilin protein [Gammaproteobacteria bacterium]MBU2409558.1 type IV pilin protein [Gammaproteobacteria bacterium]
MSGSGGLTNGRQISSETATICDSYIHRQRSPVSIASSSRPTRQHGFTLIEVMITVAIVGILAAIAIPAYQDYVRRGQVIDATNALSAMRANMERYYQDNRTYADVSASIKSPCSGTAAQLTFGSFVVSCNPAPTATTFTLVATGSGPVNGAQYSIDQSNVRATAGVPTGSGWTGTCATSWILKKGQTC